MSPDHYVCLPMPLSLFKPSPPPLPFAYDIVRSARRSISIEVAKAQVLVRAPYAVARAELDRFVREKAPWVEQKLAQQRQQLEALPQYSFTHGSQIPLLGKVLTLVVHRQPKASVTRYGQQLWVILSSRRRLTDEEQAKRLVSGWYQEEALVLLREKTARVTQALGVTCREVTIKATRSKWGHCTVQGVIQYNWHILLAPEPIVDYLVAHEVCHLVHHNHSPAFWALVASVCPDFQQHRTWLKQHGAQLMF